MTTRLRAISAPPARMAELLRAAWDDGEAVLPLDPAAPAVAIGRLLSATRPAVLTEVEGTARPRTRHLDDPLPVEDRIGLVIATSGSTGRPRGVELSRSALEASTSAGLARLGCRQGERWALALPTSHVAGLQVILRSWRLGTDAVVVDRLESLGTVPAEHVALVPTQLRRSLDGGVDLARFDTVLVGGARLEPALRDRAVGAGARIIASYGMTETCGGCVYDGVPLDGVDCDVAPDGRVRLRGEVLFDRYREEPEATAAALGPDGWFTTGDLGRMEDGRLVVAGRADDMIVTGGENVAVADVVATLRTHAEVADAAVVGVADPTWGERVVAIVVPRDPASPPELVALRDHVRAVNPASHAPRQLVLVTTIPRDAMGKISRSSLRSAVDGG